MKLILNRILKTDEFTIGELFIDGKHFCDVLEDKVRPLPKECPNTPKGIDCKCSEKVYGKTAVPAGTYEVKLTYSNRFKQIMPELLNVPHFLGIRIHKGNSSEDTEGCILVGTWDDKEDWISNSKAAYDKLMAKLKEEKEIEITIKNI